MDDEEILKELAKSLLGHIASLSHDEAFGENYAWAECAEEALAIYHLCKSRILW